MLVFAYGTLRPSLYPDKAKHFRLTPKGEARIVGPFTMINLGGFPGLVKTNGASNPVVGEVSEVASLRGLDGYEGYPNLYNRQEILVKMADGKFRNAWVYTYNGSVDEGAIIPSGDWSKR